MANKFLLKKSSVSAKVPLTTDLDYGELALNYADGKLYYKTSSNTIDHLPSTTSTSTFTNKTLTTPTINGGALSGTFSGVLNLSDTTASTSTTTGAVKIAGGLGVAGSIYADQIRLTNNGNGTNVYIGDDVRLGDVNSANTLGIHGLQDATKGYIVFGNSNTSAYIGRDGTNPITVYGGQFTVSGTATGGNAIMLQLNGYTNKGGTGYHDFLSVTNTYSSATNPNKFFRMNSTGNLEIINSAYTTNIFTLTDAGVLTVPQISAGGSTGTTGQVLTSSGTGLYWSNAGSGTVTSITAGTGLTGGTITTLGTIAVDTTVIAQKADTTYVGTTAIALNRSSANQALTGILSVTLPGSTSGSVQIIPASAAGTGTVLTLPATTGTVITSGDTGTVTSTMIADGTIVNADISASAAINISKLSASTISGVTLGGNLNGLTIGTGLSGTSYNGSSAVTIAIDSTVATLSGTQTLTNKTLTLPVIDNVKIGYSEIVSAASTTNISVATGRNIRVTGSTTHTIKMPVTSTLAAGLVYEIENSSTGVVTVQSSGGNTIGTIPAGLTALYTCIGTTLTTAADWDFQYSGFNATTGTGSAVFSASPTISGTLTASAITATSTISITSGTISLAGITTSTISIGTSATSGTTTIGGTSQTGTITIGRSTAAQTVEIATGATAASTTKTINIGTAGLSTSTTNITLGSSVSGALGTITLNNDAVTRGTITQASGATSIANQAVIQATVATTQNTQIDTFAAATYRSAKYVVQITQGTSYQVSEILVIHDGTNTTMTEYGMMNIGGVLGTFSTNIVTGNVRLIVTMASATSATINITRTTIVV